jgi:hypothetical protein
MLIIASILMSTPYASLCIAVRLVYAFADMHDFVEQIAWLICDDKTCFLL